ncbi:hypothetical protein DID88_004307 [Monilinia fructigena]|uniref:Uncharacterized protein n=1 Tax=Monilinia fructigena TaxID=38457 RepID=A0A395IY19_9HELO|nr:hypothetical protein DID88_004307 [Monilinia fructigena]
MQLLVRQKAALKAAMSRQGQRPKDMKPRQELVSQFMMMHMSHQMSQFQMHDDSQIHTSFVPIPYEPSIIPLENLTPIHIKDLRLETHHRGSYLLVRALTPPFRMTGIMVIVEDENADALQLQLYQQPEEKLRPAASVITVHDVFIIKEPYLKTTSDGGYGLRIDHVSDLVCLDANHDMLPKNWKPRVVDLDKTADDWKQEGNVAMGKRHYWAAIQSYTAALQCLPSAQATKTIYLNRALAHLNDGSFDAAFDDTKCMISLSDAPEKALYRAGRALYELGRFSECHDIFESLCKKYPDNSIAAVELERTRAFNNQTAALRPRTFVGSVFVKPSPGRGQGLFTTKAVKAGELLLCEKAFAHCYAGTSEDSETQSKTTLLMDTHTNRITMGTQSDLITNVVQKLWKNPSLIPKFKTLHHGSYKSVNVTEVDKKACHRYFRKREKFLIDLKVVLNARDVDLAKAERLLTAIDGTYKHPATKVPRLALRKPYLQLAEFYAKQGTIDKAVSMTLKALASLGFVIKKANLPASSDEPFEIEKWGLIMDGVIGAWTFLCNAYAVFAPQSVKKAEDCARVVYKIYYGEDHTFKLIYDE